MGMQKLISSLRLFLVFTAMISLSTLHGQEILKPLKVNSQLMQQKGNAGSRTIVESRDTLCLPFQDDFSGRYVFVDGALTDCGDTIEQVVSSIYPSSVYWVDSNAFVNITYPTLPPTYGVVTLDGIDKHGKPYNEASSLSQADFLTSRNIFLGGPITDSVYLSFYYQPGGFGEFPNNQDSLILEFKDADGHWDKVWSTVNLNGDDPQSFQLAMIPVADDYHYDGFSFRFRNWAGVNGNNDHWHIDYVLLDDDRTYNDTLFRDVAIMYEPEPYLQDYRQMPWNQFKNHQDEELAAEHGVFMYNNFNTIINTSHQYGVTEKYSGATVVPATFPVSVNFDPFSINYNSYSTFEVPAGTPGFDDDSLTLRFTYSVDGASDVYRRNDTLVHDQAFYNYYAYDDGTAERAYAIVGTGAKLAMHFFANEPDTLKEIYIHWAYVDGSKSDLFFSLMVWDNIDTTGASGDENIVFQNDFLTPKYVDSLNGFYVYKLVDFLGNPTPIVVDGDFYVGWLQSQEEFLNVGFDANSDAKDDVYFNVGAVWQKSALSGAVMIRPQVGGNYSMFNTIGEPAAQQHHITAFPNPAESQLQFAGLPESQYTVDIFDRAGAIVQRTEISNGVVSIYDLPSGLYIARLVDTRSGMYFTTTFIRQ